MKKKIVAVLLCVLTVCAMGVSLVACNDEKPVSPLVGNWIGYVPNNSGIQYYLSVEKISDTEMSTKLTVRTTTNYQTEIKEESYSGKVRQSNEKLYNLKDEYFAQNYYNGVDIELSEDKQAFALEKPAGGKSYFKRTDLTLSEWQNKAYTLIPNGNGDVIYKALYFEGEDRRLFTVSEIWQRFNGLQEGGYIRYNDSEMYYLYLTRGDNQKNVFNVQAIKVRSSLPNIVKELQSTIYYSYISDKLYTSSDLEFGGDLFSTLSLSGEIVVGGDNSFTIKNGEGSHERRLAFNKTDKTLEDIRDLANYSFGWDDWF